MKKLLLITLVLASTGFSQTKDPYKLLNKVKEKFKMIKDYQVDAKIKVDVEFLKVPDMTAKIYYKYPDMVKLDSKEFAMLPKQAFNFSPLSFMDKAYNAIYMNNEANNIAVIKIIPSSDSVDFILSTLWINTKDLLIQRVETTGKRGGTSRVDLKYSADKKYPLPSVINFYFEVPQMRIPSDPRDKTSDKKDNNKPQSGTVIITYFNYKINIGLSESIFKK
jgi:outer membrane lipoprotein-sorting protein